MWLCYLDESGNTGKNLNDSQQPLHLIAAVLVKEEQVMPLAEAVIDLVEDTLPAGAHPAELHGADLYGGAKAWAGMTDIERNKVFRDALALLRTHMCVVAYASINKPELKAKGYSEVISPHLLAMQFLLEKIDSWLRKGERALVVADEMKEHEYDAIELVSEMQRWGSSLVPGRKLEQIIDTVHFVRSKDNPGVQMADMVAYVIKQNHLIPRSSVQPQHVFIRELIIEHINPILRTWRQPWPPKP